MPNWPMMMGNESLIVLKTFSENVAKIIR